MHRQPVSHLQQGWDGALKLRYYLKPTQKLKNWINEFIELYGAGCYGVSYRVSCQFWPPGCREPHLFAPTHIMLTVCSKQKWLAFTYVSNFPSGALQMINIPHERTAVVQLCLPSMINSAKSGIQATTTVAQFTRCNFRTHIKGAS